MKSINVKVSAIAFAIVATSWPVASTYAQSTNENPAELPAASVGQPTSEGAAGTNAPNAVVATGTAADATIRKAVTEALQQLGITPPAAFPKPAALPSPEDFIKNGMRSGAVGLSVTQSPSATAAQLNIQGNGNNVLVQGTPAGTQFSFHAKGMPERDYFNTILDRCEPWMQTLHAEIIQASIQATVGNLEGAARIVVDALVRADRELDSSGLFRYGAVPELAQAIKYGAWTGATLIAVADQRLPYNPDLRAEIKYNAVFEIYRLVQQANTTIHPLSRQVYDVGYQYGTGYLPHLPPAYRTGFRDLAVGYLAMLKNLRQRQVDTVVELRFTQAAVLSTAYLMMNSTATAGYFWAEISSLLALNDFIDGVLRGAPPRGSVRFYIVQTIRDWTDSISSRISQAICMPAYVPVCTNIFGCPIPGHNHGQAPCNNHGCQIPGHQHHRQSPVCTVPGCLHAPGHSHGHGQGYGLTADQLRAQQLQAELDEIRRRGGQ